MCLFFLNSFLIFHSNAWCFSFERFFLPGFWFSNKLDLNLKLCKRYTKKNMDVNIGFSRFFKNVNFFSKISAWKLCLFFFLFFLDIPENVLKIFSQKHLVRITEAIMKKPLNALLLIQIILLRGYKMYWWPSGVIKKMFTIVWINSWANKPLVEESKLFFWIFHLKHPTLLNK